MTKSRGSPLLKDWPPSADFKSSFPELYEDFNQATPIPNYVRRDGVLNIASHFPSNTVSPDLGTSSFSRVIPCMRSNVYFLGPKMYNAMASFESQGSKGTTRLHMDMSDAVNIMLYSANTPDADPGLPPGICSVRKTLQRFASSLRRSSRVNTNTIRFIHNSSIWIPNSERSCMMITVFKVLGFTRNLGKLFSSLQAVHTRYVTVSGDFQGCFRHSNSVIGLQFGRLYQGCL